MPDTVSDGQTSKQQSAALGDNWHEQAQRLEACAPEEILAWALGRYAPRIVLTCSFGGPSGMVLLDMVMRMAPDTPVLYLDTDLLFPETYALVERASAYYGITPIAVHPALSVAQQAAKHGEALWARDPDLCCHLRKVVPQREAMRDYDAWITGLRRDQSHTRRATPVAQWDDKFGLVKISPLALWDERTVWRYIAAHHIPTNTLHASGYPSVGCTHCTRPALAGGDLRSGRWSGFEKIECGLHTPGVPPVGS